MPDQYPDDWVTPADPHALPPGFVLQEPSQPAQGGGGIYVKLRPPGAGRTPNVFDQYDEPAKPANVFDQYDEPKDPHQLPPGFQLDNGPDDWVTPPEKMGTPEKVWRGVLNTASFGMVPAIEGLGAAAGPEWHMSQAAHDFAPIVGAAKMLHSYLAGHPNDQVRADYEAGRQKAAEEEKHAGESWAYTAGQVIGALATPAFGALKAGTIGERALAGAAGGAIGGGLYGGGSAISSGASPIDIARSAETGGLFGAATGGTFGAALGPRLVNQFAPTAGQRAAQTAQGLGETLPRGLASDYRAAQATTSALRSVPVLGSYISGQVERTAKAAGKRVGEISGEMSGGATDRAAADALVRPALEDVIEGNRAKANQLYDAVRNQINPDQPYHLPRTDALLNKIMAERQAAGWTNPAQGLEQFRNVAGAGSFNGAHRARVDARNAGSVLNPNPGYNKADFNRLTRAMTGDIRDIVHTEGGQSALDAFDKAESEFGPLAEQNALLNKLVNARGEGAIATLLGSAKEQSGNVQLLAQLKRKMAPQDFQQIGGTLLHELGQNPATGEFSLAKFVTGYDKLSKGAKGLLFSPQHQREIENIVGMGQHIKGALKESNTSHTANVLVAFDLLKDISMAAYMAGTGAVSAAGMIGAAPTAAAVPLMLYLASPAKAASMSAWARAYRAASGGRPTPGRIAGFNLATRNLANNLGVPAQAIMQRVAGGGTANAQGYNQ